MSRATAFNAPRVLALLTQGLSDLNLDGTPRQVAQLVDYIELMAKWNPVYNLTSIRDLDKMVSHHLLDSLAILPVFEQWLQSNPSPSLMDVGTGGGLPGIVLAIMRPDWQLTLIDPVHKKTAFLTQVKAQLGLSNVNVITGKVEDLPATARFDLITSRAFASISDFVALSAAALAKDGIFGAMKGLIPEEELVELAQFQPDTWQHEVQAIFVPQLEATRHLIKLSKK